MADNTAIEWTDATWNPITGCNVVSPGCTNCYAMKLAGTRLRHHPSRAGLTLNSKAGPVWTGEVRLNEEWVDQPLRWRRPRRIFVCAHGDLFAEGVPDEWIDRIFAVMALAHQHTFQVLTKRPDRMRKYFYSIGDISRQDWVLAVAARVTGKSSWRWGEFPPFPLPNVWLGVSVEDQQRADERIPDLLATPAAKRFVSAEPLLGPVDFTRIGTGTRWAQASQDTVNALTGVRTEGHGEYDGVFSRTTGPRLDWVIVGGESGPNARPMHPDWARSIRDRCASAGTAFFMKQIGGQRKLFAPIPDDLNIREFPE